MAVKQRFLYLFLALAVMAADQFSKYWVMGFMGTIPNSIEILPFFNLVVVWNRGVSFGLFNEDSAYGAYVLIAISSVIAIWFLMWLFQTRSRIQAAALALVIGGAVGNIIDRILHGAVYDFLDFHLMGHHWPAFNIADSAVVIGVFTLIFHSIFLDKKTDVNDP